MDSPLQPRHQAKSDLAVDVLRRFGQLRLGVTGASMLPAIQPADTLLIRHCAFEEPGPNDVVLFERCRRLYIHRVVSRTSTHLVTQGDGLPDPDMPITAQELLGKVVQVTRNGRILNPAAGLRWPARLGAAVFSRSALAGRVFMRLQGLRGHASP